MGQKNKFLLVRNNYDVLFNEYRKSKAFLKWNYYL